MFHDFFLARYYPIHSKVHSMNPISKLLCFFLFMIIAFFSATMPLVLLLFMFLFILLNMTNVPICKYLEVIKFLIPFYFLAFIINVMLSISFFDTIIILLRLTSVLWYMMAIILTTPFTELIYGLEKIFSPLRIIGINPSKLALSITLFLRSFSNLMDEINRIIKTEASRGLDFYQVKIKDKIKLFHSFIMPALLQTARKNEELKKAMILRLYSVNYKRTNFRMNRFGLFDGVLLLIHIALLALVIKEVIL